MHNNKTVILLHGLGAHSDSWQLQWPALQEAGYRVIVPDFTGFGRSAYSRGPVTVKTLSDEVYAMMRQIGIQRAHIIGLSLGGAVAMQFALDHPVIVEKLVLSNTAARFVNKARIKYFALRFLSAKLLSRNVIANSMANFTFPKPEHGEFRAAFVAQILQSNRRAYMRLAKSFLRYDLEREIQRIKAPTLIVSGAEDRTLPTYMQEFLHERIKGSKLVMMPGGHVSAVDSSGEFNRAMVEFLAT